MSGANWNTRPVNCAAKSSLDTLSPLPVPARNNMTWVSLHFTKSAGRASGVPGIESTGWQAVSSAAPSDTVGASRKNAMQGMVNVDSSFSDEVCCLTRNPEARAAAMSGVGLVKRWRGQLTRAEVLASKAR